MTPAPSPTERFRARIDAAVAVARAGTAAGVVGRLACVGAAAVVVVAAVDLWLRRPGFWAGGSVVAAAIGLAAWRLFSSPARRPADRLRIAQAIEAAHPELGERVSRAVGFLDAMPGGSHPAGGSAREISPVTRGLQSLAVEQAAAAVDGLGRPPVPGLRMELLWWAAGLAAVAAVWGTVVARPQAWGTAVRRQLAPATALRWPQAAVAAPQPADSAPRSRPDAASVPEATVAVWTQLESLRRLAGSAAERYATGRPVPFAELQRLLRRARDDSARAIAASNGGSGVLTAFAAEFGRLERLLAAEDDRDADAIATLRQSLDGLSALARAAAGIADASVFEAWLAGSLDRLFQRQPGLSRDELASPDRDDVDRLAGWQSDCAADIEADGDTIRRWVAGAADAAAVRAAVQRLDALDLPAFRQAAGDIQANRLFLAAAAASRAARPLAEAASFLGMPAFAATAGAGGPRFTSQTPRSLAELRRMQALIDDRLPPAGPATASAGEAAVARGAVGAAAEGTQDRNRGPADAGTGVTGRGDDSPAGASATGEPTLGGGVADRATEALLSADARAALRGSRQQSRQDRVWNLLPERERPVGITAADVPVPASYRAAVDSYYQSLLEATQPEGSDP
jgi:hypothetical protein